ncbi:MAG TPA: hypothetical protein VII56_16060 [Rhizomicrobium sp.]
MVHRTKRSLAGIVGLVRYQRCAMTVRRQLAAATAQSGDLAQRATLAWSNGDTAAAERDWRALAAAQPLVADWPIKLAFAAEVQGDNLAAERIVEEAWGRGARSPDMAERIAFFHRTNRLSNTTIDDAIAIVRDPDASPAAAGRAAGYLLSEGRLEPAREGLARIAGIQRYAGMLRSLAVALDILQEAQAQGRTIISGSLSPARDAIEVREPGADTTVIVFTTLRGDCGVPVSALHALLQPAKVNAIYLFDERKQFNLDGSTTFGRPYGAMIEGLRAKLDAWGTRTLIVLSFSAGAFTAMRAGLDLKAQGALLFSPIVTLHRWPEHPFELAFGRPDDDSRMMAMETYLRRTVPQMMTHLPDELRDRDCLKTIEMHYGYYLPDLAHINEVWTVPGIDFRQLEGFPGHECLSEILRRGDKEVLTRFIARVRAASSA